MEGRLMTRKKTVKRQRVGGRRKPIHDKNTLPRHEGSRPTHLVRMSPKSSLVREVKMALDTHRNKEYAILADAATQSVVRTNLGTYDYVGTLRARHYDRLIGRPISLHTHPYYGDAMPSSHDIWQWTQYRLDNPGDRTIHGVAQKIWMKDDGRRRRAYKVVLFDSTQLNADDLQRVNKVADTCRRLKLLARRHTERVALEATFDNTPEGRMAESILEVHYI